MLPDYAAFEGAIGLDWYELDPNLAQLLDRLLPDPADRSFAEEHVRRFGRLCGTEIARRAEVTDEHPPELVTHARWGHEIGRVEHHPAWEANKADLVRAGFVELPAHADRPVPAVLTAALATFVVPRQRADGSANGFSIRRLEPKLGTRAVPTAEVTLDGATAWLAEPQGRAVGADAATPPPAVTIPAHQGGLSRMMEMVNGSRFGVALMGLGIHRRSFLEAAIYAARREQWGQRIDRYPMVSETLVDMVVILETGCALTFECAAAARTAADEDEGRRLRRILVPLAKIRVIRDGLGAAIFGLEILGGNGYMEDWPLARQLRDAQCHTIWEGTENICCLDVRCAIRRDGAHLALLARVQRALDAAHPGADLAPAVDAVAGTLADARDALAYLERAGNDVQLLNARRLAFLLADLTEGALLLDEATWALERLGDARKAVVARRFTRERLVPPRARGILDEDRTALDHFDAVVRYGAVEPASRR